MSPDLLVRLTRNLPPQRRYWCAHQDRCSSDHGIGRPAYVFVPETETTAPYLPSARTEDGVAIVLWGGVEIAVTIIAASIPVLRILIREVKVSSRGGYHNTEGSNPATRPNRTTGTRGQSIVMTARGPGAKARQDSSSGNQSDESILSGKPGRDVA